ncbi:acyl-CoA dehydrogenase family protein [Solicola gregarius]|uniref:Acyl-CoA dehydrogenase family protein n=1 Tax=Solicola gregarius TaxID=2908642 RepID=A0AA46YKZ9_9ACTN|nr:acyl-CoA dehydrogenase family protein [Solicola gregarius]UYM06012.1 acyl-CoA dehydrogenase family protein [Solicola gregarius]
MPTEIYGLTEEQTDLFALAADFGREQIAPYALEWDLKKEFPVDVLRRAADLGMGGIYVGDDVGGSGLSRLEAALIIEGLAYGCPSIASYISIHNMVAGMIDRFGNDEQRRRWLPDLCSMAEFGSYCLTEAEAGSDAAALRTRARRDGDTYVLNGAKQFISGSGTSGTYVVMARTSDDGARGITAFVVENGTPGLSFGADELKMGWNAQPTREVRFDDVRVPAENLLAGEGMGFAIAMSGLDGGRVNIAASSLGGAQAAYDKALAYVEQRRAFGRSVAEFQATQFRIADMATELEAARLLLHRAARALDDDDRRATELCAMAKRHVTDTCFGIANDALQLHGGYGYLHEYGIEKIVRDLRVHQILEGTNEIMRVIISRAQRTPKVAS